MAEAQTKETQTPRKSGLATLELPTTVFTVSLGAKGARASWTAEVTGDFQDFPPHIRGFLAEAGFRYMMSQAASGADRESEKRLNAKPGETSEDFQGVGGTAYTPLELEARALELAKARVDLFKRGETGKLANVMSPIDRKAFDNVVNAIRAKLKAEGRTAAADAIAQTAKAILATSKGDAFREEARKQIEAEQAKAATMSDALGDLGI